MQKAFRVQWLRGSKSEGESETHARPWFDQRDALTSSDAARVDALDVKQRAILRLWGEPVAILRLPDVAKGVDLFDCTVYEGNIINTQAEFRALWHFRNEPDDFAANISRDETRNYTRGLVDELRREHGERGASIDFLDAQDERDNYAR